MGHSLGSKNCSLAVGFQLMNEVIKLRWFGNGVAFVAMEDRASRNRSSEEFLSGIEEVFRAIQANSQARVVVITGYDNYFCCGGTREELLLVASRQAKFTDFAFYDQLLRCEIPVVAAMQGHAIGGGLVFGAYADVIVLAEESIYSTNFMHYGITPGIGATWVIPHKFGSALGWEMLFTAKNYFGRELRERGAPVRVAQKAEVVELSCSLAHEIAEKPLLALRELKRCFYESVRNDQAAAIQKELRMQADVFAHSDVIERVRNLYPD
jgi:polyketide biosynthesis enoyl-CoA hydratase PksI